MHNPDKPNDDLIFNPRTLRLIIGVLAFAFPLTVIALTGKITKSISASYHEPGNRDVFVGFLFILGALLIAYKGHVQGKPRQPDETVLHWILSFKWFKVYQEEIISTLAGLAAIFTALYPTACDDCTINTEARIHSYGAIVLFVSVVYFSLVAFLRSVNQKLVEDNPAFKPLATHYKDRWFASIRVFIRIAGKVSKDFDRRDPELLTGALQNSGKETHPASLLARFLSKAKSNKFWFLCLAYERKLVRGAVYLICGPAITVTLAVFVYIVVTRPDAVAQSITLFVVEWIALGFFGIAWMTASKLEYLKQILSWLPGGSGEAVSESKDELRGLYQRQL